FALASVLGVGEGHLLHRKTRRVGSGDFAKIRKSFSEFPYEPFRYRVCLVILSQVDQVFTLAVLEALLDFSAAHATMLFLKLPLDGVRNDQIFQARLPFDFVYTDDRPLWEVDQSLCIYRQLGRKMVRLRAVSVAAGASPTTRTPTRSR
ncbi:hypothetical protein ACV4WX_20770, partial [Pseudomonas aeruginosa]